MQDGETVVLHPRPNSAANLALPCGKCLGCLTARQQEWATRCMHEAREHSSSIFVTLTYSDKHLPKGGTLLRRDLTLFLKRLRQAMARKRNHPPALSHGRLRYIAAGEYGARGARPHYHAILFGVALSDAVQVRIRPHALWRSATLEKLWRFGLCDFGAVTAASAAYTASYTVKEVGTTFDGMVVKPFVVQSLKPGIGATYAHRYSADFLAGNLITDGVPTRLPRYYKKLLERDHPQIFEEADFNIYRHQVERRERDPIGSAPERLVAAEVIAKRRRQLTATRTL